TDRDIGVRRLAIERIGTADVLAEIAAGEPERSLRDLAGERAAQLWMQHACGEDAERAGAALAGIIKLGDQRALVDVVVRAERAKKPGIPDDVKRRRAEKAQLVREVEAVVDSHDYAKAAEVIKAAEVAWAKLGGDDGDDRFTRTAERFWIRKQIHDHQARTA